MRALLDVSGISKVTGPPSLSRTCPPPFRPSGGRGLRASSRERRGQVDPRQGVERGGVPDSGEIRVKGSAFRPRTVVEAHERGVSTAFQELSLVPSLSVAVNMFLPRLEQNRAGFRRLEAQAAEILREYSVTDIRPSAVISDLPLGMRQPIEIVRAVHRKPSVLLLAEATAALSDWEWLFDLVERVRQSGAAILYISHKPDEIRASVPLILRNGRKGLGQPSIRDKRRRHLQQHGRPVAR